jgi:hypothetical protein
MCMCRTAEAYVWGYLEAYAAALAMLVGIVDERGERGGTAALRTSAVHCYNSWVRLLLAALSHPANLALPDVGTSSGRSYAARQALIRARCTERETEKTTQTLVARALLLSKPSLACLRRRCW